MYSAAGKILPPLIMYPGQRLPPTLTMGGTQYCVSPKGWMTEAVFLDWFQNLLIPTLPEARPTS